MKINKKLEPIISGVSAAITISFLAFLTEKGFTSVWLMFSFGATVLIVFVNYKSDAAQPKNIFFGHLVSIIVGILIVQLTVILCMKLI